MENKPTFNEWVQDTKFGSMWAPTLDDMKFYQDHEFRKKLYLEVKDLPKVDFERKTILDYIVGTFISLLNIHEY